MVNAIYYVDHFYWYFIISDDVKMLAFRTWWGTSEFIRVVGNYILWCLGLLFWALTFLPFPAMQELFMVVASFILFANCLRLFSMMVIKSIAFLVDDYETEYKWYPYKIMWGGETTKLSIDYSLELSTFIGQLIAYPLMVHSVK